jgi:uncharacterized membrane protein YeiH
MAGGEPYLALEYIGSAAFAVSGATVAVRAAMDWLGVAVLAVVAAVGGGTLRDLLLGRLPVGWIQDPWPVLVALGTAAVVIADAYWHPRRAPDSLRVVLIADAAGLAAFTVNGTLLALAAGVSGPVAVLLGVVSGTGGGVVRDVLARQRALILVGQIYALTAVAGATILVVLTDAHAPPEVARWIAVAVAFVLRMLAIRYSWSLPRFPSKPSYTSGQPKQNNLAAASPVGVGPAEDGAGVVIGTVLGTVRGHAAPLRTGRRRCGTGQACQDGAHASSSREFCQAREPDRGQRL